MKNSGTMLEGIKSTLTTVMLCLFIPFTIFIIFFCIKCSKHKHSCNFEYNEFEYDDDDDDEVKEQVNEDVKMTAEDEHETSEKNDNMAWKGVEA